MNVLWQLFSGIILLVAGIRMNLNGGINPLKVPESVETIIVVIFVVICLVGLNARKKKYAMFKDLGTMCVIISTVHYFSCRVSFDFINNMDSLWIKVISIVLIIAGATMIAALMFFTSKNKNKVIENDN